MFTSIFRFDFDLFDKAKWLNDIFLYPDKMTGFVSIDSAPLQRSYVTAVEIWLLKRMEPVYAHYPWKWLLKSGLIEFKSYVSFYKSIVDQDRASVVICNLKHEIIYMNPAAVTSYAKRGGDKLIGRSLLDCHSPESRNKIQQVVDWFAADESHNIVYTFHNEKQNKDVYMVALRDESKLIGYYEKHEYRNSETMKPYDLWYKMQPGKGLSQVQQADLDAFKKMYGIDVEIEKEY